MADILNFRLKLVFYVHFILIVWATLGNWCPTAYLFYNVIFIVTLLWGVHHHNSEEPIQLAILVDATSIIFDIIVLSLKYHDTNLFGDHFSLAMSILNLVSRPFTTLLLYRILQERNGTLGPLENVTTMFGNRQQTNYEDIDRHHQSVPSASGEPEFYQPKQIA